MICRGSLSASRQVAFSCRAGPRAAAGCVPGCAPAGQPPRRESSGSGEPLVNALKTLGIVVLVVLALVGAVTIFFFVTCLALIARSH